MVGEVERPQVKKRMGQHVLHRIGGGERVKCAHHADSPACEYGSEFNTLTAKVVSTASNAR